ncbi:putative DNA-binding transcriptional regulator YafY [Dyadobacter jejuensis]|uniref:Putative DNA-binding transcriptional regulator YafY n=2 Tax=Dyadobacter jejuensis TaxID=1082580 RepID=A0A316AK14_9BACT|nr:putative DNA-binding transcriptional regulator YafY [Dyadobacter jejuensis]
MIDSEVSRLSRLVALLTLLQTKRVMSATELAKRFSVSTRTIYRDIRTLEAAGIPITTQEGKGYAMLDGYRLPPVMFTREEVTALLTAEKLAAQLTDPITAQYCAGAMDKLRAALRYQERDHLEALDPHIQVLEPAGPATTPNTYQQMVAAITSHRLVYIEYAGAETGHPLGRELEPIGLYRSTYWHVVAYCRLRNDFRNFRLDRIKHLVLREEVFSPRPETLRQYWADQAQREGKRKVVIHVHPTAMSPSLWYHLQDTRQQYGWTHQTPLSDDCMEMVFLVASLPYMATWLLPYAGAIRVVEPPDLREELAALARRTYDWFGVE